MILGNITEETIDFLEQWNDREDYIIAHTSGSTGAPKPIKLMKADMIQSARATCDFFGIQPNSLIALPLSTKYIAGKMQIVRALERNCRIWIETSSSKPLQSYQLDAEIALLPIVPSQIDGLLESHNLQKVKTIIIGGAPLSPTAEKRLIDKGLDVYCTYGMTETCSHVALRRIGRAEFTAMPGISFEADNRGCLVINCPNFSFNCVVTNDLVEIIDKHTFRWLGRIDNVINSGGVKLFPEVIEKKIAHLFNSTQYYITSRRSERWGEELILVVESAAEISELEEKLRTILNRFEMPKAIIYQTKFNRTASRKIIRDNF